MGSVRWQGRGARYCNKTRNEVSGSLQDQRPSGMRRGGTYVLLNVTYIAAQKKTGAVVMQTDMTGSLAAAPLSACRTEQKSRQGGRDGPLTDFHHKPGKRERIEV